MGCRLTGESAVAMYDSTAGVAFGPVLGDRWEADAWMEWFAEGGAQAFAASQGWRPRGDATDPRTFSPTQLEQLHAHWSREQEAIDAAEATRR